MRPHLLRALFLPLALALGAMTATAQQAPYAIDLATESGVIVLPAVPGSTTRGGVDCEGGPGVLQNDDGTAENGYSALTSVDFVTIVDMYLLDGIDFPIQFTHVCVAFLTLAGGPAEYPIEIRLFDADGPGGEPGKLLGAQSATAATPVGPPILVEWTAVDITDSEVVMDEAGAMFVGARWAPAAPNVFMVSDQTDDRPVGYAGGFFGTETGGEPIAWAPLGFEVFENYRAMFIRPVIAPFVDTETGSSATSLELTSSYPNPARSHTTVGYTLPQSDHVTLRVYDLTGRLITTLVDGVVEAGTHSVQVDVSSLASGVYVYQMQASGVVKAERFSVVR